MEDIRLSTEQSRVQKSFDDIDARFKGIGLSSDEIPVASSEATLTEKVFSRLRTARSRRISMVNAAQDVSSRFKFLKPVVITGSSLKASVLHGNIYYVEPGGSVTFSASYMNQSKGPIEEVRLNASVLDASDGVSCPLDAGETKIVNVTSKPISAPVSGNATASSQLHHAFLGLRQGDTVSKSYPIGILDYHNKPLSEFPNPNAVPIDLNRLEWRDHWLPWLRDWRVPSWQKGKTIFAPASAPFVRPYLELINVDAVMKMPTSWVEYGDKYYRHKDAEDQIDLEMDLTNKVNFEFTVPTEAFLSCEYEDANHYDLWSVRAEADETTLKPNAKLAVKYKVTMPKSCYGKVTVYVVGALCTARTSGAGENQRIIRDRLGFFAIRHCLELGALLAP